MATSADRGGDATMTRAVRLFRLREWLTMSLWVAPSAGVVMAVLLAEALLTVDRRLGDRPSPFPLIDAGADGAQTMLSVIAASMVTSISLIFSVTMVVLQLASAQYSPRVLASFIRDRFVQAVLAAYIGTFVYALLVLPAVHAGEDGRDFVPDLAVTGALVLALASLTLFVRFVHHVAHAIRAVTIINKVAADVRSTLGQMYPHHLGDPHTPAPAVGAADLAPTSVVCWPSPPGVLVAVDEASLMELAVRHDSVICLRRHIGDFVPTNSPLFDLMGDVDDERELLACATVGPERTIHQDAAFGLRQLVDIAERALSPGVNDPTTAVQCLDQVHDLLRRLAVREFPSAHRADERGRLRVVAPTLDWEDYVHLGFDEIRHYSGRSIQVERRLVEALEDLLTVSDVSRHGPLQEQLTLVHRSIERSFEDAADRRRADRHPS